MKRNKILILGAAFTLAMTPLLVGCGEMASAMAFRDVKKNVNDNEEGSFTAEISAKNTISAPSAPTGSTFTLVETYGTSKQMTGGNSQTLTVNLPNNYYLTGLSLSMKSNKSSGSGTLTINDESIISDSAFNSANWYSAWSTSYVSVNITNNEAFAELVENHDINDFTIVIAATANSLYCQSYTISWIYLEPDVDNYYYISYESNGGSSVQTTSLLKTNAANGFSAPTNPTKDGYDFGGWYSDENFEHKYNFSSPVTSDMTLYAKWIKVAVTSSYSFSSLNDGDGYRLVGEVTNKMNNKGFMIQDGNNAFYVFDQDTIGSVAVGNTIDLYGTVTTYNGVKELTNVVYCEKLSSDTENSQTPLTSLSNVKLENMYQYVEISGLQLGSAFTTNNNQSFYTASLKGETVSLYTGYKTYVNGGNFTYTDYSADDYISVKGNVYINKDSNIEIYFTSIEKMETHTVTFNSKGGSTVLSQNVLDGNTASEPAAPTKDADEDYTYTFDAWYADENCEGEPFDFSTAITSDITLYAGWIRTEIPAAEAFEALNVNSSLYYSYKNPITSYVDTLNNATTGVTGQNYLDWTEGTTNSGVTYSGNSAGLNSSIQLRTKNGNSGIVVTNSNPKYHAKRVSIEFESHTLDGRTVEIYGSNSAYTSAADLYGDSKGELLISFTCVNLDGDENDVLNFSFDVVGNYNYIGIKSSADALYLNEVSIDRDYSDYEATKAGLRFNQEISKSLWNKINNQHPISRYGMLVSSKADYESCLDKNHLDTSLSVRDSFNACKASLGSASAAIAYITSYDGINDYYVNITGEVTNPYELDENTYKWAAYTSLNVNDLDNLKEKYIAVGYLVVDGEYYFTEQTVKSFVDVCNDYLDTDAYDEDSAEGSLFYLANL